MKFPYMAVILVMRLAQEEAVAKYNGRSNRQLWPTKDSKNPTKEKPLILHKNQNSPPPIQKNSSGTLMMMGFKKE